VDAGGHNVRRSKLTLGLAALMVLGACQTDRVVTRPEPVPVTEELLAEATLQLDDLPESWEELEEGTPISTEMLPEHPCDDALAELEPEEQAAADFTGPSGQLTSVVAWFPGQGGAVEQVIRDVAADCASVVATDAGLSLRTGPLNFGVLSDRTLPLKFEVEPQTGPIFERDLIVIRRGDLVSVVRLEGPRPSDIELLDSVVRVALGRVSGLAQATG
jgi:hypothetical protein